MARGAEASRRREVGLSHDAELQGGLDVDEVEPLEAVGRPRVQDDLGDRVEPERELRLAVDSKRPRLVGRDEDRSEVSRRVQDEGRALRALGEAHATRDRRALRVPESQTISRAVGGREEQGLVALDRDRRGVAFEDRRPESSGASPERGGVGCGLIGEPWVHDCDVDGAGEVLGGGQIHRGVDHVARARHIRS